MQKVYREIERREARAELYDTADAALVFVAYGTCARLCREAVDLLRDEGLRAGMFRPITLWPFPSKKLQTAVKKAKRVVVVEMSAGQMIEDVRLALAIGADRIRRPYGRRGALGEGTCRPRAQALGKKGNAADDRRPRRKSCASVLTPAITHYCPGCGHGIVHGWWPKHRALRAFAGEPWAWRRWAAR